MPTYLDVGVQQIQSYLGRSPRLRAMRGASALISHHTSSDQVSPIIQGLAADNTEAGDVDGVISVLVDDEASPDHVADRLLAYLRTALPGANFAATWGQGATYLEAHHTMYGPGARTHAVSLPTVPDVALARRCQVCHLDVAQANVVEDKDKDNGTVRACRDCSLRYGKHHLGRGAELILTERMVKEASDDPASSPLDEASIRKLKRAKDFRALGRLGPGKKRNHLGTVYVDGNAVGQFFGALATSEAVDREAKQRISVALVEATWSALTTATLSVLRPDDSALPVVPHVVGGDDVLVSLPASRALAFTITFLRTFNEELSAASADLRQRIPDLSVPTSSAGIVFAHQRHPFNRTQPAAAIALAAAKQAGRGNTSSIAWTDITRNGEGPPLHAGWTLQDLDHRRDALTELAELPASASSRLDDLLHQHSHPRIQAALLASEPARLGLSTTLVGYLGDPSTPVAASLDLARWWPTESTP